MWTLQGEASACQKGFVDIYSRELLDSLDNIAAAIQLWSPHKPFYLTYDKLMALVEQGDTGG